MDLIGCDATGMESSRCTVVYNVKISAKKTQSLHVNICLMLMPNLLLGGNYNINPAMK